MRSQHPTDVLERENEAYRRFLREKDQREKQLRCGDCKRYKRMMKLCIDPSLRHPFHRVNPGQYACNNFVYRTNDEAL